MLGDEPASETTNQDPEQTPAEAPPSTGGDAAEAVEAKAEEPPLHTEGDNSNRPPGNPFKRFWTWLREPNTERPRWTDVAIVILTGGIVFLGFMQWREMHEGGKDTHDLAVQAKSQADAAGKQADAAKSMADSTKSLAERMKDQADRTKIIAEQAVIQARAAGISAQAASSAAKIASDQLVLSERPWVKIKHRIANPLTFNVGGRASGKDVASIIIEDTLENVGQTAALNVFSWEDIIPLDSDFTRRTAQARQEEWCGANRHRPPSGGLSGFTLFPHDPMVQQSTVGPTMETVTRAATNSPKGIEGKVGFVLVGCVAYRSSFEPQTNPAHETWFVYYLAVPDGPAFNPYIVPRGIADSLRLVVIPDGFRAD